MLLSTRIVLHLTTHDVRKVKNKHMNNMTMYGYIYR